MTQPERLSGPVNQYVQMIFPTAVAVHPWPNSEALNAELRAYVLDQEARSPSLGRSNVGGWHSDNQFILRDEPCLQQLVTRIRVFIGELTKAMMKPTTQTMTIEGWANVLRHGQYNSIHVHPNSTWSGVYYVTGNPPPDRDGNPEYSGKIEFIDPRPAASACYTVDNMMQRRTMLSPPAGTMIAFPSWLQHQVHPYFGDEARISIAFNVVIV